MAGKDETIIFFMESAEGLAGAVSGLAEEQLDCSLEPKSWSIRQIVHHVADDCDVWSMLIKKAIVNSGQPVHFEGFPGNEPWANGLDFHLRPIQPSIGLFMAHRAYLAELLEHFQEARDRTVRVMDDQEQVAAEFSVEQMVGFLSQHMVEHTRTIEAIKQQGVR